MARLVNYLFGFLPPYFQVLILIGIVILVGIFIFKIIALVLDAIPFL